MAAVSKALKRVRNSYRHVLELGSDYWVVD